MESDPDGQGNFTPRDRRPEPHPHLFFARAEAEYAPNEKWMFSANLSPTSTASTAATSLIDATSGRRADTLYRQERFELGLRFGQVAPHTAAGNRRRPPLGTLRQPHHALIPALFVDWLLSRKGNIVVKASGARNYRYPTLNDR